MSWTTSNNVVIVVFICLHCLLVWISIYSYSHFCYFLSFMSIFPSFLSIGIQPSVDQFHAGYSECLSQVSNFLTSSESMSLETRRRLLTYLADKCLTGTAMDESKQTGSHLAPPSPTETRISPPTPHRMPSLPVSSPSIVYIVPAQAIQPLTQAMVVPHPQCSPTQAVTSPGLNILPTPPHSPVSAKQHSPAADNGYHKTVLADASMIAASVIPMVTVSTPVSSATQDSNVWRPWWRTSCAKCSSGGLM